MTSLQKPMIQDVQEDDALLSLTRDNHEISRLYPVKDFLGLLGQV